MWLEFHKIEKKDGLVSKRTGKTYSAYVMSATKKGFDGAPNEPYEKIFFDSSSCTVVEHGRKRPNKNIVQYLQKTAEDGDTIIVRNIRKGNNWEIESMENISKHSSLGGSTSYEPLSEEEVDAYKEVQPQEKENDLPWAN